MGEKGLQISKIDALNFVNHKGLLVFMDRADDVPFKVRYHVVRLKKKLEAELKEFNETREEIIKQYSVKVDDQVQRTPEGGVRIDPKYLDVLNYELKKHGEEMIELPDTHGPLEIDFDDKGYKGLSGSEIEALMMVMEN